MKIDNGCSIYIRFGNKKVRLPVNPEELKLERSTDHSTYQTIGKGEIVVPKKPSLQVASWEGFFPDESGPYTNPGLKSPEVYVKYFEKAMKNRQKCRLVIVRDGSYDTNLRCIVNTFTTTDKGGEPGDVYYEVELQEYRDYSPERVSIVTSMAVQAAASPGESIETSTETERSIDTPVMRVGATVVANGKYWYTSAGQKPYGTASNVSTTVTRIVPGADYPIHIGDYGWLREDQLQVTG